MKALIAAMALGTASLLPVAAAAAEDPYLWLEEWGGKRVDDWIAAENAKTLSRLKGDARYDAYYRDALAALTANDRVPEPIIVGSKVYNLWRDAEHPQGILRVTSVSDFANPKPRWKTVLDLGALSKAEGIKWVYKDLHCYHSDDTRCLIELSDGGKDAVRVREINLRTGQFVSGGFDFPESKQTAVWFDRDTVMLSRDWGAGTMTESSYPFVVKKVKRGQPLSAATEVFRGTATDVSTAPALIEGAKTPVVYILRGLDFFNATYQLYDGNKLIPLPIPQKTEIKGVVGNQLVIRLAEDWAAGGTPIKAGALVSVPFADALAGRPLIPTPVLVPTARQSIESAEISKGRVLAVLNDNVRGRIVSLVPGKTGWQATTLALPDNQAISIRDASEDSPVAYFKVAGFTDPEALWQWNGSGKPKMIKQVAPKFDASNLAVEQFEAKSTDGTMIPYFIVHRKDLPLDGTTPTLLNAYGGFEVSETPVYSATLGKLWLERGNSFVLANIRGGGEFGPAWHEAGLKTKRQIIYDDFAAVGRDLVARKLTSKEKLGIYGGSNGGLLMGVEFTQHPELWQAVTIQVPLLDMIRMEKIAAGASWVGEYGSPSVPEEKAFWEKTSPYQNIRKGVKYPEPFIWTTTKDDRVGPQHARKFAARLKEYGIPYLFFEDTNGGHSGDADVAQRAMIQALQYTYFSQKLEGPGK